MRTILLLVGAVSIYRNPFVFRETRVPVAPRHKVVATAVSQPAQTPAIETTWILPPAKPLFPWRYIGSFGPESDRVAAFAKDHDVLTVRTGDAIDDYVIREITPTHVDLIEKSNETRRIVIEH